MKIREKINAINQEITRIHSESEEKQMLRNLLGKLTILEEEGAVEVSFVVVAMNIQEASEFLDEEDEIFDWSQNPKVNRDQTERFQKLQEELKKIVSSDEEREQWLSHYAERREEWVPHIYAVRRPENTIVEIIERATIMTPQKHAIKFWPDFVVIEDDLFAENTNEQIWDRVQERSVLVIDGLSLFHPHIRQVLSKYAPLRHAAILMLSPVEAIMHALDVLIEKEIEKEMSRAFGRFDRAFEQTCEFGVNNERGLKRWLFASLPELAMYIQKPGVHPGNRGKRYGDRYRGMYEAFPNGGRQ